MWKYNDELYHAGVLGMRWGFRKRSGSITKSNTARKPSEDHLKTQELKKKKLSQLSNKELQDYNNRKNLERNYKSFKPKHIAIGLAAVGTTATLLGNYRNIKSNLPDVISDGKSILDKMKNVRLPIK